MWFGEWAQTASSLGATGGTRNEGNWWLGRSLERSSETNGTVLGSGAFSWAWQQGAVRAQGVAAAVAVEQADTLAPIWQQAALCRALTGRAKRNIAAKMATKAREKLARKKDIAGGYEREMQEAFIYSSIFSS